MTDWRPRRFTPSLDLDTRDLEVVRAWFEATYERRARTAAEAVTAFTFNAIQHKLMAEADRQRPRHTA
jgi:hypothetical protein